MNYENLVNGIKQNDNSSIVEFYNEFYKDIYYVCYKITGNEKDAEDVAQETLFRAINKIDLLEPPERLPAWLRTIANNLSINYLKKNRKFDIADNYDITDDILSEEFLSPKKTPEDIVADKEVADILISMIDKLPEEQRITIFMFYYEEMSVKEISETMNCSEATVRSRINYAKKSLRKQVEELENKGIKLRCTAILPFLLTIYSYEKYSVVSNISLPDIQAVDAKFNAKNKGKINNKTNVDDTANKISKKEVNKEIKDVETKTTGMSIGTKIAIGVLAAALVIGGTVGGILLSGNGNVINKSENNNISSDLDGLEAVNTEPTYELNFAGRWGDIDLGISYLVPLQSEQSNLYDRKNGGTKLFQNGAIHETNNGDNISVAIGPSSFDNIDNLFIDCYKHYDGLLGVLLSEIKITSKKDVRISDMKAVYYEGTVDENNTIAGYVVDFNGQLINVNVWHCTSLENCKIEESLEYSLQMILSFEEYDGRAISEMSDNNVNLSSFFRYSSEVVTDSHTYTVNHSRLSNTTLYPFIVYGLPYNVLTSSQINSIDYESIVNSTDPIQAMLDYTKDNVGEWFVENKKLDRISSEKITIAGIEMDRNVMVEYQNNYPVKATVMYSFVEDGQFIFLFDTKTVYEESYIERNRPTEEEWKTEIETAIKDAEKVAGSVIRTIQVS